MYVDIKFREAKSPALAELRIDFFPWFSLELDIATSTTHLCDYKSSDSYREVCIEMTLTSCERNQNNKKTRICVRMSSN